jgi:23S rRNA pseudouridine1911/1915/1917 synthase
MPELWVPKDANKQRVDKLLSDLVPGVSRATVQRWLEQGRVTVNGAPVQAKFQVSPGQRVVYEPALEPTSDAVPDASVQFEVLFEDAHLLVVNKPAGLVVHPAKGNFAGTLVNGLLARDSFTATVDERDPEGKRRPGIVHRIDKDTSGVLVVAKTALTREGLKVQFANHTIERRYFAICVGTPNARRFETLYGRHPTQRLKFSSRVLEGKHAVTHVEVLESLPLGCSLVGCQLETGRTHQIRVHLYEQAGAPLLADALYGSRPKSPELASIASALGRQALHAGLLGFVHPVSGATLRFEAALPADFQSALSALRAAGTASESSRG